MRILPHDQNSGGFFVALLRKGEDFQWKYEGEKVPGTEGEGEGEEELLRSHMPEVENAVALEDDGQGEREKIEKRIEEEE
jgi:hypothetical protein